MKALDLIARLQELVEMHGDLEVYSTADWTFVRSAARTTWSHLPEPVIELEG